MRGEIGLADHTAKTTHSSIVRPRKEKADVGAHVFGVREPGQGTRWVSILVPFSSPNASADLNKEKGPVLGLDVASM